MAAPVVAASPVTATFQSPAPVTASPDFIIQALLRNTEMEERLAQLEGKLGERSRELDVRDRQIVALEADLTERSAHLRELDSNSVRRTTLLDCARGRPASDAGGNRRERPRSRNMPAAGDGANRQPLKSLPTL